MQLDPLPAVRAAHLGLLWAEFREEFPNLDEQLPLDALEEQFEPGKLPVFQIQIMGPPQVPRLWFISADQTRLLQVQQDRFLHNWRRVGPGADYPRYEQLREDFETHFQTFASFVSQRGLGKPRIRHAEISYINQLQPGEGWTDQGDLDRVIRMWSPTYEPGLLEGRPEDVRVAQRHLITDAEGPYARLYVAVEPVLGGALVLNLTVRGCPRGSSLKSSLEFFDMGREKIVKGFTAVTTAEMHELWGRIQ